MVIHPGLFYFTSTLSLYKLSPCGHLPQCSINEIASQCNIAVSMATITTYCGHCREAATEICPKCNNMAYCSAECQEADV